MKHQPLHQIKPENVMPQPKVSVITVVKNARDLLGQTIRSVGAQTYQNKEYIIVDSASTDGTMDVIEANMSHISKWVSEEDQGVYHGMNKAIDMATGDWIYFLNAGDWFFCDETLENVFSNSTQNIDFIYGHCFYHNKNSFQEYIEAGDFDHLWKCLKDSRLHRYWLKSLPCHQTIFIRSEILKKNKFDTTFKIAADHKLTFDLYSKKHKFLHTNIPISIYSAGGYSQKMLITGLKEKWRIAKNFQSHIYIDIYFTLHILKAHLEKILFKSPKIYSRYQNIKAIVSKSLPSRHSYQNNHPEFPTNTSLIFLHIPKTAGTTMYQIIRRQFPRHSIYEFNNNDAATSNRKFKALPMQKKKKIRAIHGHMWFGLHRHMPNFCQYITILRNPVERIISHYHFTKHNPKHYLHHQVISQNLSLEEYVNSGISTELDNGQTRLLAGDKYPNVPFGECTLEMLNHAKENLKKYFTIVGIQEEFKKTLLIFNKKLGWEISFFSQNISSKQKNSHKHSERTREVIMDCNRLDIELYKYARTLFSDSYQEICKNSPEKIQPPMISCP